MQRNKSYLTEKNSVNTVYHTITGLSFGIMAQYLMLNHYFAGLPLGIVAVFYVVTFILYKYQYGMPVDFIYGDVNNNGQM